MMYAVHRELHPPTGVEHCLECNFFDPKRPSLVVASTSLLRVYMSEVRRALYRIGCGRVKNLKFQKYIELI